MIKLKDVRVLIAEDDKTYLKILAIFLRRQGALVSEATNGEEALAHLRSNACDLILSDVQMPRLGGVELLKKVRERDHRFPIFLFLTGQSSLTESEIRLLGAAALVRKPFRMSELMPLLVSLLANELKTG